MKGGNEDMLLIYFVISFVVSRVKTAAVRDSDRCRSLFSPVSDRRVLMSTCHMSQAEMYVNSVSMVEYTVSHVFRSLVSSRVIWIHFVTIKLSESFPHFVHSKTCSPRKRFY